MTASWEIRQGGALEQLRLLESGSVQTVVTSPPYYQLRRYLPAGSLEAAQELGHEPAPDAYVDRLIDIFAEVWRVLRDDGVIWVNLGSTYSGSGKGAYEWREGRGPKETYVPLPGDIPATGKTPAGYPAKCQIPIPMLFTIAMIRAGWVFRADVIWHKVNGMPSSVTDRPTINHEYILFFSKQERYFSDFPAIAEPVTGRVAPGEVIGIGSRALNNNRAVNFGMNHGTDDRDGWVQKETRNVRSVWAIPTEPLDIEHYAAFPTELARRCIVASTSEKGQCPACGSPWRRVVEKESRPNQSNNKGKHDGSVYRTVSGGVCHSRRHRSELGWTPACACDAGEPVPQLVLDPFSGSGRCGIAALRTGRRYLGLELSPTYAALSRQQIQNDSPMFNTPTEALA